MLTPVAGAHFWRPRRGRAPGPEVATRIVSQMIKYAKGPVLLRNGENVQGESARWGHHELVHLAEVRK